MQQTTAKGKKRRKGGEKSKTDIGLSHSGRREERKIWADEGRDGHAT
jgi:hypothetical protein